jgi:glutathione peroxidase-family protein
MATVTFKEGFLNAMNQTKWKGRNLLIVNRIRKFKTQPKWANLEELVTAKYLAETGSEKVGDWQDFMQWIIDNREQIIAFIKAIIALFTGL